MSATIMSAAAGTDIHICAFFIPPPPHGPGAVSYPYLTLMIGNFPAARMGDTIIEEHPDCPLLKPPKKK